MSEYIAQIEGEYYQGSGANLRLMSPQPVLLSIRLTTSQAPGPEQILLEHYFDALSRIRKGVLYSRESNVPWSTARISPPPVFHGNTINPNQTWRCTHDKKFSPGTMVSLGGYSGQTQWMVISNEEDFLHGSLLTLKAKTFFGVLPELVPEAIPENERSNVISAIRAVVDSAPTQAPQPVIDTCKHAIAILISAKFPESNPSGKEDIGRLVSWLFNSSKRLECTDAAKSFVYLLEYIGSHLVNQLHSRAKPNAAFRLGTRPTSQWDAALAVQCVAFLLQDFGWAVNE